MAKEQTHFKFQLEGGLRLQVQIKKGSPTCIELEVPNATTSILLHWGVLLHPTSKIWVLPSHWPTGTKNYKQKALQTPFKRSRETFCLTIEIQDPKICAIEFVLKDEARDKWFKLNGQNVHIDIPRDEINIPNASVPEDLVQVKAFIQWELKGKKTYTPEQEKQEYEEARKELQMELLKGISVPDLRKKLQSGGTQMKVDSRQGKMQSFQHIPRKKRDASYLMNKFPDRTTETKVSAMSRKDNTSQLHAYAMEGLDGRTILQKTTFKLGDKQLLVHLMNNGDETCARLVTDISEPIILHWGLSKNSACEWLVPSPNLRPKGSNMVDGACETPFKKGYAGDASFQSLELKLGKSDFIGLAFVLRSDGQWIKNNGSDFYISLKAADGKHSKSVGDGKGTVKWLLDAIAEKEMDAERSLMHRFSIATELTERARCEGKLGLAGILVWMRFMVTRQLTWNKNYNVKPREISAAQDKFTNLLQRIFQDQPHNREFVRLIMSTVGRGGEGDVGQRIRDEILVIQRNNDCKGGMMEEWHQKLHNNTSPDDVVICQALLDYIKSGFNIDIYWKTLNKNGVTKERLASYDRPIKSVPSLRSDQKEGLIRDLTAYMKTLKPKKEGGLGYKSTSKHNRAWTTRLYWRMLVTPHALWAANVKAKYAENNPPERIIRLVLPSKGSPILSVLRLGEQLIKRHCFWTINNGQTTNFLTDAWDGNPPLIIQYPEFKRAMEALHEKGWIKVAKYCKPSIHHGKLDITEFPLMNGQFNLGQIINTWWIISFGPGLILLLQGRIL
ncbi:hypothetical protein KI387_022686 [Taxus chinensis]|uniref:Uncharacterized protein n=1 Tax=Taxus chinensis TaxID=29808 RepID=A0AA38L649_TAXCH|nr:hypothetical protein KI387_022686 [Taxus chinensis]